MLSPGQASDGTHFDRVMAGIRVPRLGRGRPRTRSGRLLADKAYASKKIRESLRARGISHTIPQKKDHQVNRRRRGSAGGRRPVFDAQLYNRRNGVERCFNRLKQYRGLATRYAKRGHYYRSEVVIASIMIWLAT